MKQQRHDQTFLDDGHRKWREQVNGEHSTQEIKKLPVAISPPGRLFCA
ncbi:hypothetical protein MJ581_07385 [Escherichia coli]|nr:hypothetical protein MJ581_07385 [Escherichia coli]